MIKMFDRFSVATHSLCSTRSTIDFRVQLIDRCCWSTSKENGRRNEWSNRVKGSSAAPVAGGSAAPRKLPPSLPAAAAAAGCVSLLRLSPMGPRWGEVNEGRPNLIGICSLAFPGGALSLAGNRIFHCIEPPHTGPRPNQCAPTKSL
jgi:hypothetical protein